MYQKYLEALYSRIPLGESFDIIERKMKIGGRQAVLFFVQGLTDGEKMQRIMDYLMQIKPEKMEGVTSTDRFIAGQLPFMDVSVTDDVEKALRSLYSGLVPLMVEGLDQMIIIDVRAYPSRSVQEPEKEKSLRGAKDGFTEGFMNNIGLIRRRIRSDNLVFKAFSVGKLSKTDVSMAYIKGNADEKLIDKMEILLKSMENDEKLDALTVGDQSLLEKMMMKKNSFNRFNPFPKVRYSQRPDIISAHIAEGKIALIVDNSPTVMLLPVGIFDFLQDVDDYYFPEVTGNYFRILRTLNFIVILLMTPVYLLIATHKELTPEMLAFFVPDENFAIPLFWQFILLEIAVDALKLASLNTPDSLGMSLSVIGALILGEFSINSGWFIPQTILCMAVVALASFTQPSIELSYATKFTRITMLIGAYLFGVWGIAGAGTISFVVMSTTKTLSGDSYLYPLIPFRWDKLKRLLFRTKV